MTTNDPMFFAIVAAMAHPAITEAWYGWPMMNADMPRAASTSECKLSVVFVHNRYVWCFQVSSWFGQLLQYDVSVTGSSIVLMDPQNACQAVVDDIGRAVYELTIAKQRIADQYRNTPYWSQKP